MKNIVLEAVQVSCVEVGASAPVLQGLDLQAAEGELTAILCGDSQGRDALLRVLAFRDPPSAGEIRFQGRVVGRQGPGELDGMRGKALILETADLQRHMSLSTVPDPCPCIILANDTDAECCDPGTPRLASFLRELAARGAAVVLATSDPRAALWASTVYKLSRGKLQKIARPEE